MTQPPNTGPVYTYVHKCSPFNSTDFTTCCGLAVLDNDRACPGCGLTVIRYERPRSNNCLMCGKPRHVCNC